jgi:hypothetical protein
MIVSSVRAGVVNLAVHRMRDGRGRRRLARRARPLRRRKGSSAMTIAVMSEGTTHACSGNRWKPARRRPARELGAGEIAWKGPLKGENGPARCRSASSSNSRRRASVAGYRAVRPSMDACAGAAGAKGAAAKHHPPWWDLRTARSKGEVGKDFRQLRRGPTNRYGRRASAGARLTAELLGNKAAGGVDSRYHGMADASTMEREAGFLDSIPRVPGPSNCLSQNRIRRRPPRARQGGREMGEASTRSAPPDGIFLAPNGILHFSACSSRSAQNNLAGQR